MRFWLILAVLIAVSAPAQAGVTVYELFTARDCPSCPPADELFTRISRANPDIISLSCHVTYFDRPGRADSLSKEFCDGRQTGYKMSRVVDRLYTPAVVVNGIYGIKGNDEEAVMAGLSSGNTLNTVQPVYLSVHDEYLNVTLPNMTIESPAEVWLFAYNNNRAVTYITKLMRWNGKSVSMAFPVKEVPAAGYAVIAQTANQTNVLAAGKTN